MTRIKWLFRVGGAVLILIALLFGVGGGGDLPDHCAGVANFLDRGELLPNGPNQVTTSLGSQLLELIGNTPDLSHDRDTSTHRIWNVSADCGSAETMADRAHAAGFLKFQTWPVGLLGVLVFALSFLGKAKKGCLQTAYA